MAGMLTKSQTGSRDVYWVLDPSGTCWYIDDARNILAFGSGEAKAPLIAFLSKRQGWITTPQDGQNPFDAKTLEELPW